MDEKKRGAGMMLSRDEMVDDLTRQGRELLQAMNKAINGGHNDDAIRFADKYKQLEKHIKEIRKKGKSTWYQREVWK